MTAAPSAVRAWLDRYRARRVFAGWALLSALLVGYVVLAQSGTPTRVALGPLGSVTLDYAHVVLAGVALPPVARRPLATFGAVWLVGIATIDPGGGCFLAACPGGPTGWQFALDSTALGPELLVAHLDTPGGCLRNCPHSIYLAPLAAGYLLVGEALAPTDASVGECRYSFER
jgi:hypothetical protein